LETVIVVVKFYILMRCFLIWKLGRRSRHFGNKNFRRTMAAALLGPTVSNSLIQQ